MLKKYDQTPEQLKAANRGVDDWLAGKKLSDNPYHRNRMEREYKAWYIGFTQCENDPEFDREDALNSITSEAAKAQGAHDYRIGKKKTQNRYPTAGASRLYKAWRRGWEKAEASSKPRIKKTCSICGKNLISRQNFYCSRQCSGIAVAMPFLKSKQTEKTRMRITQISVNTDAPRRCKDCGIEGYHTTQGKCLKCLADDYRARRFARVK